MKGTQTLAPLSLSIVASLLISGLISATDLGMVDALSPNCHNLTGIWIGNDNGIYYIRQDGATIYWLGVSNDVSPSPPSGFANVFKGEFEGNAITGTWADIPLGAHNNRGLLWLTVSSDCNTLEKQGWRGGFGGSVWTRS